MPTASAILNNYPKERKYILSVLHELMDDEPEHYLSEQVLTEVADYFGLSKGVVYGLAGYYSMLDLKPGQKNILSICCSPVCAHAGSEVIMRNLASDQKLLDELQLQVKTCECLGLCPQAPAASLGPIFLTEIEQGNIVEKIKQEIMNPEHGT